MLYYCLPNSKHKAEVLKCMKVVSVQCPQFLLRTEFSGNGSCPKSVKVTTQYTDRGNLVQIYRRMEIVVLLIAKQHCIAGRS
jgi:hypothetical protein